MKDGSEAAEGGHEGRENKEGRALVREAFLQRLAGAGLVRPKGMGEAAHAEALSRLAGFLSYMGPDTLAVLAELVLDHAEGPRRNVWPSEAVIRGLARGLQERPLMEHPIVTSWLASIEGPKAELGGYLVELLRFLRRHPRPPMAMDRRKILEEAAENQRGRELMLGRVERGTATADDRAALAAYEEDLRQARDIVAAGRAKREAGKGQAA
ncbi:MAG: hypothetical protein JG765_2184 [Cereibacter sp.]|jgi:hypothetical protein|nr:hypothetical protein [Cereibacter sp.]